jgi:hypothetical protein
MITLLRQLILQSKTLLLGASSTSINGLIGVIPAGMMDSSFLSGTTSILGFTIPTFLLYLVFTDD